LGTLAFSGALCCQAKPGVSRCAEPGFPALSQTFETVSVGVSVPVFSGLFTVE